MPTPARSVVIHGHFYQPPREDPWSGRVEAQPSANPYHDWNVRVEQECYRAVVAARVDGESGHIRKIVNTLRFISFNFGPTLLAWMETEAPATYEAILEADRLSSLALGGHGNAMAQAYHHSILPLASRRDKVTEVRWGVADFRRRFQRDPAGMWLPETAVDAETLEVLAEEGIAFTIVAPHQVNTIPRGGLPALYRTGSGKAIALFVYDGPLSHEVAFGPLLKNAKAWAQRLTGKRHPGTLVSMATDGETYGHHHWFGEMALAAVLEELSRRPDLRVENFASFLARNPPQEEVMLLEPSSWSCSHGVERWRGECGCKMAPEIASQQRWRVGLREAMEWLAGEIHELFQNSYPLYRKDPWEVRNDYGRVVVGEETLDSFLDHSLSSATVARDRAHSLLELERNALSLFTSCAWFFDDLAGIEPLQILRYAARGIELLEGQGLDVREGFLHRLGTATSNETPSRDGATIFRDEEEIRTILSRWAPEDTRGDGEPRLYDPTLGHRVERALRTVLSHLGEGESADAGPDRSSMAERIHTARQLADHLAHRKIPIPFDAQTIFYRTLEKAPASDLAALSTLREPLGFVSD